MIQFRRLVSILLGIWLGAGIVVDLAVTKNFSSVDRFLQNPNSLVTSIELNKIGRDTAREVLRRNAAEENNAIFEEWEWSELAIGSLLFLLLLFGDRPQVSMLIMTALMVLIVLVQRFLLSPQIVSLGRLIPGLPAAAKEVKTFWLFHGVYSGSELLKLGIGFAFAGRLIYRPQQDPEFFKREYETRTDAPNKMTRSGVTEKAR